MTIPNTVSTDDEPAKKGIIGRVLPLVIIAGALTAFFGLGLHKYITLDALEENQESLKSFISQNFVLAAVGFALLYMTLVAIFVPGASILTIAGGFLFGPFVGPFVVVVGATLGAMLNYIASRWMLRDLMEKKAGPALKKMEAGFQENELSYMFILRLIPAFPFFIVNVVAGLIGVKFRNYLIGTVLGIIPGTIVYTLIGNGLGAVFASGEEFSAAGTLTKPEILAPIIGLTILALVPVLYKRFSGQKNTLEV